MIARVLALVALGVLPALLHPRTAAALDADADSTLRYELRAGDDPARVARMFRIPVEELLQRNGIRDASRLRVGTVLDIPDPRAVLVQDLRAQQEQLRGTVDELRATVDEQHARTRALEADLQSTRVERDALASRLTLHRLLMLVAGVALCVVLALGAALALVLGRLREETARRVATVKHGESLRAAVERYRNLGAQLELKYQSLYRQGHDDSTTQASAQALRAGYDQERATLEARVEESAAALAEAGSPPPRRRKHHEAA